MLGEARDKEGRKMSKLNLFVSIFKATNLPGTVHVSGDSIMITCGDRIGMVYEIARIAETLELTCSAVMWRGEVALQIF